MNIQPPFSFPIQNRTVLFISNPGLKHQVLLLKGQRGKRMQWDYPSAFSWLSFKQRKSIMTAIFLTFTAIVLVALFFTPRFNPKIYKNLLFSPVPYSEEGYVKNKICDIEPVDVFIRTKGGNTIHGWYYKVEGADQAVLLSHGNAGNVGSWGAMASLAVKNGYSCLVYDYRGYGLSDGVPTPAGIVEDGLTAYDFLVDNYGFKPEHIVLFGISMGSGVSCQIALQREYAGIILQSGYSNFRKLTIEVVPISRFVPGFLFFKQPLDNAEAIQHLKKPKLIFHGAQDELIIIDHAHDLYERAPEPKELVIFPEGKHSEFGSQEATFKYASAMSRFLRNNKPAESTSAGSTNC